MYLLLGAVPFPKDVLQLKQLGVGAIITLNEPYETLVPTSLYHVSDVVCADSAAGDWEVTAQVQGFQEHVHFRHN
ncbi:unnamed protein product [Camellia sinensis]